MASNLAPGTLAQFFYWINERHTIYLRRQAGEPKPWTENSVLRDYKFTNPFRQNDRGTVWLTENFVEPWKRGEMHPAGLDLLAANICWYRMFNWTGTGELLGWRNSWDQYLMTGILTQALASGKQVFTGAHIVYSPPGKPKVDAIVEVCSNLWTLCVDGPLVEMARGRRSLEEVYDLLRTVHCVGGFMAYEMVTDFRHTPLLSDAVDIYTWANPGPGAKRGLQRLGLPHTPDVKAIESMRYLLGRSSQFIETFRQPTQPVLEMRDIEHSLCEFDKYMRVLSGEGQPRSKFNGAF